MARMARKYNPRAQSLRVFPVYFRFVFYFRFLICVLLFFICVFYFFYLRFLFLFVFYFFYLRFLFFNCVFFFLFAFFFCLCLSLLGHRSYLYDFVAKISILATFFLQFFHLSRRKFEGGYTCDFFYLALATPQSLKKSHHLREQKIARVAAA